MIEFLIRRVDGEWFDLMFDRYPEVFHPNSVPYERVSGWGCHRIKAAGVEISVSDQDPGYQISFEGTIDRAVARQMVEEMMQN